MNNILTLILTIATVLTGFFWCVKYFIWFFLKTKFYQQTKKYHIYKLNIFNKYNLSWIEDCSSIFPTILFIFLLRSFVFEPFQIPSGSMMPTLLIGDFILVEKFAYNIKNPITYKTIFKIKNPKHGDIVVFRYPLDNNLNYVKRIIGLPGDKVIYDPIYKRITIKTYDIKKGDYLLNLNISYNNVKPSNFVQNLHFKTNGDINIHFQEIKNNQKPINSIRLIQCRETIGNSIHNILTVPNYYDTLKIYYKQKSNRLAEWVVPLGQYFVMGDNRDNSSDSRYWGFVPENNLLGKVVMIWISFDKEENKWPTGIRLHRIGTIH